MATHTSIHHVTFGLKQVHRGPKAIYDTLDERLRQYPVSIAFLQCTNATCFGLHHYATMAARRSVDFEDVMSKARAGYA